MTALSRHIIDADHDLLLAINSLHSDFFDSWMWNYSQKWTWIGLYIVLVGYLIYRHGKNSIWILLCIGATFGLSDWLSHELKHLIMRPRPTHNQHLAYMINLVNDYRGGAYGFPSSHAANSFALATMISLVSKDRLLTLTMVVWATINAYSRMYLGVHYPLDILTGMLLGFTIAFILYLPLHAARKDQPLISTNAKINQATKASIPTTWILTMIAISFV